MSLPSIKPKLFSKKKKDEPEIQKMDDRDNNELYISPKRERKISIKPIKERLRYGRRNQIGVGS